jgi:thiosulfate/3-mercaptopyruvate sulfurtransferase
VSSNAQPLVSAGQLLARSDDVLVVDCRFSLTDADAGEEQYRESHIPGALYLHLQRELSAPLAEHGGRHPLPDPAQFCGRLAAMGIGRDTAVVAYDANGMAYAARLWWMMASLGYTNVRVLDGGLQAWLKAGGTLTNVIPGSLPVSAHCASDYADTVDIDGLRESMAGGAVLIDSREEKRYLGLEELIDPVAGHIPGAMNYPWQSVTDERGVALNRTQQVLRWQELEPDRELVVYCGSGVTACVNILSLQLAGRKDVKLYAGSWSDWCSWMSAS